MTRRELIALIAVLGCLTVLFTALKVVRTVDRRGDTAVYFQTTGNIAHHGRPDSDLQSQIFAYFQANVPSRKPAELATLPLSDVGPADFNMMRWHAYYVLYPIAMFVTVLPVDAVLMTLYALSFTGLLGLAYADVRNRGSTVPVAIAFGLLVVSYPAWSSSLLDGQFYPDRLFMTLGYLVAVIASSGRRMPLVLIATTVVCGSLNERAALVAGGFLIAYSLLWWRDDANDRSLRLLLGAASLVYAVAIKAFTVNDYNYASYLPANAGDLIARFQEPVFAANSLTFVVVNAALFAIALFEWRAAVIAALAMLPNVIGTIGGAEKVAWSTHYHSYYLPLLIWAAVRGFEVANRRFDLSIRPKSFVAAGGIVVVALFVGSVGVSTQGGPQLSASALQQHVLVRFPGQIHDWLGFAGTHYDGVVAALERAVPSGSIVTTPETGMPILYENRRLSYLPERIDSADYALLENAQGPDGRPALAGVTSYLGSAQQLEANAVVLARMHRDGYDFTHAQAFPELGLTLVRRIHR